MTANGYIFQCLDSDCSQFVGQIWYSNVPHPKLVEYKKDQRWVVKSDDYFVFPGGGTQFKDGVGHYIDSIEKVTHQKICSRFAG